MNEFEANITALYKEAGERWLAQLSETVDVIAKSYGLSSLKPVTGLSYNYVLAGFKETLPIVLKIGFDTLAIKREAMALRVFANYGAVKVICEKDGMLILERARPGNSLKSYLSSYNGLEIACSLALQLHKAPLTLTGKFLHIRDWLKILDKNWNIPVNHLRKARQLKDRLLKSPMNEVLLHGDLHMDNILKDGNKWMVIDPKGVIGYPINEVWAFVNNIEEDTKFIAEYFGFSLQDVRDWYYVHIILAACWNLEDGIKPTLFLNLAEKAYLLISNQ